MRRPKHGDDDDNDVEAAYEPSNSEDEYSESERILLEKTRKGRVDDNVESEDEVLGFQSSGESDGGLDGADSDLDGADEGYMPDIKAWGTKRRNFYNTDYVDQDYGGFEGKDAAAAEYEEQEARAIQQRLAEQMDEGDFSLDIFTKHPQPAAEEKEEEVIKTDLTTLTKRQKLALLQKESPEFMDLVEDFQAKMIEVRDRLEPILVLIKDGKIPPCPANDFIKTKYNLILNYCTNISFYLLLKAKKVAVKSHPITHRLCQYRLLLQELDGLASDGIEQQIDDLLEMMHSGEEIVATNLAAKPTVMAAKRLQLLSKSRTDEVEAEADLPDPPPAKRVRLAKAKSNDEDAKRVRLAKADSNDEEAGSTGSEDADKEVEAAPREAKRAITYQIAKNKGLTPRRKKEQRNPRVKHRNKYRKAKIRRKGQVREPRTELQRYGGEIFGIKASISRSVKLK